MVVLGLADLCSRAENSGSTERMDKAIPQINRCC